MPSVEPTSLAEPGRQATGSARLTHKRSADAHPGAHPREHEMIEHDHDHSHRDVTGGWLRAGTFGAMDGLVTNSALIAGFAGSAVNSKTVVLAGMAGLVAGAFSMATGEYTSVQSQNEATEAEVDVERLELHRHPYAEQR